MGVNRGATPFPNSMNNLLKNTEKEPPSSERSDIHPEEASAAEMVGTVRSIGAFGVGVARGPTPRPELVRATLDKERSD